MEKQLFPTYSALGQDVDRYEGFEVTRGGLASSDAGFDQIRDTAVGLFKDDVDEFTAVDFGQLRRDDVHSLGGKSADRFYLGDRPGRRFFDAAEQVDGRGFPRVVAGYFQDLGRRVGGTLAARVLEQLVAAAWLS